MTNFDSADKAILEAMLEFCEKNWSEFISDSEQERCTLITDDDFDSLKAKILQV